MKSFKLWGAVLLILVMSAVLISATAFASDGKDIASPAVMVSEPATPVLSVAVRDLERSDPEHLLNREEINPLKNPGLFKSDLGLTGTFTQKQDPLAANSVNSKLTPGTLFDFEGLGTDGFTPPDTVGEVGPNHYIQMVNVSFAIFDKTGTIVVADTPFTSLFSGSGLTACETENDGDPIVVYDEIADRWLLSQFAVSSGTRMCIAISQTADPTGAYYLYQFDMPDFPDYFKFGVWPDAYLMGTNTGFPNQYYAYAFDRASMLSGSPATFQYSNGHPNFLLPADLDGGTTNPPPAGSPGYFYTMLSDGYPDHPAGVDRLALYEFDVDWTTPANSTYNLAQEIPIASYNYTVCGFFVGDCIPQPGTAQGLDSLSYWPMWRFAYRNLGSYEAMVGNFTVDLDGTDKAAIRWFELQKTGTSWTLHQEGTYAPDSDHRWMGSIAMDGSGNIALGYSVSSNTTLPAIRYAVHEVGDTLGTMQAEQTIIQSAGVHTGIHRWGDYSSMNVDPVDNCSFWYTNQYDTADNPGFDWHTRVGVFKIPSCTGSVNSTGTLTGQVTDNSSNAISGALVSATYLTTTVGATTDAMGYYTRTLSVRTFDVTAEAYGFQPSTVSDVEIISGTTTTVDFSLTPASMYTVDGTITDANTNWPLYALVSISGDPFDPYVTELWTDPVTGYYEIDLAEGITYTFDVEAWMPGYLADSADIGPLTGNITLDFALDADSGICSAPGYSEENIFYDGFETGDLVAGGWITTTTDIGRVQVSTEYPYDGNYSVLLDNATDGTSSIAGIIKPIDLSTESQVYLDFWWREFGDENNAEDGVFLSDDGGSTWCPIFSFNNGPDSFINTNIDLTTEAVGCGMSLGVDTQILFQFYDNFPIPSDGYSIDEVKLRATESVVCNPPADGGLVVGNIFDDNTGATLVGALIDNEDGYSAQAAATPSDDNVEDAFYTIFSPSGSKTFTATISGGYAPDVDIIPVVMSDTVTHDFSLSAGWLEATPTGMAVTLDLGISTTLALNLNNSGAVDTNFEFTELYGGFTPVLLNKSALGSIEWLYRNTEGVAVDNNDTDSGTTMAYPGAYQYTPLFGPDNVNILVYTDDWIHVTPNTLVQQAISLLGIPATVHVDGDYTGFQNSLNSGGPWDLVVWSGENYVPDASLFTDLQNYLQGGGKLVATYWRQLDLPSDPLWTEMGFTYVSNYVTPPPAYWWETGHPMFNNPESVPEWINRVQNSGTSQGTRLEPLGNGQAIAGYTTAQATNEAGIILRNDGMALYKGLRDVSTNADDDGDSILDGTELWMNIFTNMMYSDVPWLSTEPITGTVAALGNTAVDITFDAGEVSQPGEYFAQLNIGEDTPYDGAKVPVTMTVNTPASWGKVAGTLTLLGYCDVNPTTPSYREILIEGSSGFTATTSTDENGYYQWWIDPSENPLTVSVVPIPEYEAGIESGLQITTGQTTSVDFDLRWLQPCVSVDPTSIERVVFLGDTVNDAFMLNNGGAISTTFDITETNAIAWFSANPLTGTVDVDSMESINTIFDSSVLTQTGWYSGELRVNSDDPMHGSILTPVDMVVVSGTPDVALSPDSTLIGQPGTLVTHTFTVTNTGDVTDIYDLVLTGNNWATTDPPEDTSFIDPGEIFTFTVTVEIPNNPTLLSAIIGSDTFSVIASSQLDGSSATAMGTTQAEVATGVSLSEDQSDSGMVGGTVSYTLQVTNTGGYTDTINLAVSGNTWVTDLSESSMTLGAGASGDFIVTVNIPMGASESDLDLATVSATSTLDSGATDTAVLSTTAMKYWIYLPLIATP